MEELIILTLQLYPEELSKFHEGDLQPASLGCPLKEKGEETQMIVTNEDDFFVMSDKSVKTVVKKQHNLAKTVKNSETLPRRHRKQGNYFF